MWVSEEMDPQRTFKCDAMSAYYPRSCLWTCDEDKLHRETAPLFSHSYKMR